MPASWPQSATRRRGRLPALIMLLTAAWLALGCGNPVPEVGAEAAPVNAQDAPRVQSALVKPPFAVVGELSGLLLVWFDAQGVHSAQKRSEIPESSRQNVRVDSLSAGPDARLDADHVYLADLRQSQSDGSYPVRLVERSWFDGQVDKLKPPPAPPPAQDAVVIYKASWCGVCRSAASFLRGKHVPFVEKDIEKDPEAQAEMLRKAQAKGLSPHGVPVIDFRGEIMLGFDRERLESLIDQHAKAI